MTDTEWEEYIRLYQALHTLHSVQLDDEMIVEVGDTAELTDDELWR